MLFKPGASALLNYTIIPNTFKWNTLISFNPYMWFICHNHPMTIQWSGHFAEDIWLKNKMLIILWLYDNEYIKNISKIYSKES